SRGGLTVMIGGDSMPPYPRRVYGIFRPIRQATRSLEALPDDRPGTTLSRIPSRYTVLPLFRADLWWARVEPFFNRVHCQALARRPHRSAVAALLLRLVRRC